MVVRRSSFFNVCILVVFLLIVLSVFDFLVNDSRLVPLLLIAMALLAATMFVGHLVLAAPSAVSASATTASHDAAGTVSVETRRPPTVVYRREGSP